VSGISVRLWPDDAPSREQPYRLTLPAVPREGDLIKTPWAPLSRVRTICWDIDPAREPVLIVDIHC